VRAHFGHRALANPLGASSFGHATINAAEETRAAEAEAGAAIEAMTLGDGEEGTSSSGGAAGKFRQKDKKKKKKKKNF